MCRALTDDLAPRLPSRAGLPSLQVLPWAQVQRGGLGGAAGAVVGWAGANGESRGRPLVLIWVRAPRGFLGVDWCGRALEPPPVQAGEPEPWGRSRPSRETLESPSPPALRDARAVWSVPRSPCLVTLVLWI